MAQTTAGSPWLGEQRRPPPAPAPGNRLRPAAPRCSPAAPVQRPRPTRGSSETQRVKTRWQPCFAVLRRLPDASSALGHGSVSSEQDPAVGGIRDGVDGASCPSWQPGAGGQSPGDPICLRTSRQSQRCRIDRKIQPRMERSWLVGALLRDEDWCGAAAGVRGLVALHDLLIEIASGRCARACQRPRQPQRWSLFSLRRRTRLEPPGAGRRATSPPGTPWGVPTWRLPQGPIEWMACCRHG